MQDWGNKVELKRKLFSMRLGERGSVQDHIKAMTELCEELAAIGEPVSKEDWVVYLLASLPESYMYNVLVTSLEANAEVPVQAVVTKYLLRKGEKVIKPTRSGRGHSLLDPRKNQLATTAIKLDTSRKTANPSQGKSKWGSRWPSRLRMRTALIVRLVVWWYNIPCQLALRLLVSGLWTLEQCATCATRNLCLLICILYPPHWMWCLVTVEVSRKWVVECKSNNEPTTRQKGDLHPSWCPPGAWFSLQSSQRNLCFQERQGDHIHRDAKWNQRFQAYTLGVKKTFPFCLCTTGILRSHRFRFCTVPKAFM